MPTKSGDVLETGSNLPVPLGGATMNSMMETPEDVEDLDIEVSQTNAPTYTDTPKFSRNDVKFAKLRVAQPMSQEVTGEKAKGGDFLLEGYSPLKTVTLVPLRWAKTRAYAIGTGQERKNLCQSTNGMVGVGNPGGQCVDKDDNPVCPMAHWTPNPSTNKNKPPLCHEMQNYVVYVAEHNAIAVLTLKSTATKTAQGLNSLIYTRGMKNVAVQMHSVKQSGPSGTYFVPMYTILTEENMPEGLLDKAKDALAV